MKTENFSPQESLDLITQVILEAKNKFSEDGVIYTMWGALLMIASTTQYFLLQNGFTTTHFYPYFLMPLGGIISWWYFSRKATSTTGTNQISKVTSAVWITCSFNILVLGFALHSVLLTNLTPVILILLGIALSLSGVIIKSNLLLFSGIFTNITAIASFFIDWQYHPLIMALVALVAILIPGLILMNRYKKEHV